MKRWLLVCGLLALGSVPAAEAQTVYICFGDSITSGVGDDPNRPQKGYPPRLAALLTNAGQSVIVRNEGEPSENTAEGLTRIDDVLRLGGDVVLIMEGTNDIGPGISAETTRFNLDEMAEKAERRGIGVVHATTIPRIPSAVKDSNNLLNQQLNQEVRDLAGRSNRRLADPFHVFGIAGANAFETLYDDSDPKDAVGHPNAAGYDAMAQLFFDVVTNNDRVPPVFGRLAPTNGSRDVPATTQLIVDLWDFGAGIDLANTTLTVNGNPVTTTQDGDAKRVRLTFSPDAPWVGIVEVGIRSRDVANTVNSTDRSVSRFVVRGTVFLPADLDESGRVDGIDLVTFARSFGADRGDENYLREADFNNDRTIDGADLAVLASTFGQRSF